MWRVTKRHRFYSEKWHVWYDWDEIIMEGSETRCEKFVRENPDKGYDVSFYMI